MKRFVMPVAVALLMACGGTDEAGIREGRASGMLADSAVLAAMRDTNRVNRIIYDPAPDLSLSSAQQRRPDIFKPPAAPSRAAPTDTTKAQGATRP